MLITMFQLLMENTPFMEGGNNIFNQVVLSFYENTENETTKR